MTMRQERIFFKVDTNTQRKNDALYIIQENHDNIYTQTLLKMPRVLLIITRSLQVGTDLENWVIMITLRQEKMINMHMKRCWSLQVCRVTQSKVRYHLPSEGQKLQSDDIKCQLQGREWVLLGIADGSITLIQAFWRRVWQQGFIKDVQTLQSGKSNSKSIS